MEMFGRNIELNNIEVTRHTSLVTDAKQYLEQMEEGIYDLIILDPPAFAKHQRVSHNALQGYKWINFQAIKKIRKGGLLATFSCSQVIHRDQFTSAVMAAAIEAGREVKILHRLSQGPDHPVSIFHPEGEYLKGLVLQVI